MAYMSQKEERKKKKAEEAAAKEKKEKENTEEKQETQTEAEVKKEAEKETAEEIQDAKRWGSREAYMKKVTVLDMEGKECQTFQNDQPFQIRIDYKAEKKLDDVVFGIAIYRSDQVYIYGTNTLIDYSASNTLEAEGHIDLKIDRMPVNAGDYTIDLAFHRPDGFNYDFWREACSVKIQNVKNEVGVISLPHKWDVQ